MHRSVHRIFGRTRVAVLSAVLLTGVALPAGGLFAGTASAAPAIRPPTTTILHSSRNPSFFGQLVTFTAIVTPTDGGGTVAFKRGLSVITGCATRSLHHVFGSYRATCTTRSLAPGLNLMTAVYSGDLSWQGSTSNLLPQFVLRAPTRLRTDASFNLRQTLTLHATLDSFRTPLAGQLLRFSTGVIPLCFAITNSHGTASCVLSYAKSVLVHRNAGRWRVRYAGSAGYLSSSADGQVRLFP